MKAETKTVGMNVAAELWESEDCKTYVREMLDNDTMRGIFDEIREGEEKIIKVSDIKIHKQNTINMVDVRRDINVEEVVRCADCKHFHGDGLECRWGMYVYEDDYCSHGEKEV